MQEWLQQNSPVDGEDLERHDKWLCMMWPRLHLLRELLSDDGVIFISIDDNEQHHLRILLDEIFGEENFLANIVWQHRYGRSNNAKLFSNQREHIVLYRKSDKISHIRVKRTSKLNETYKNPDNDPKGPWISSSYVNPATIEQRPNLTYTITNPVTGLKVDHPTHAWKYSLNTHLEHLKEGKLWWGANGDLEYPRLKNYLSESEKKGIVPIDLMLADESGTTDEGTKLLQQIFQSNSVEFSNPKPTKLIEQLIAIAESQSSEELIILDSFAGSGTTAHAVLALNKEDGGNRKFIMVECENYADTITAERVRRVIKGVPEAKDPNLREGLGGSFTYYTLGDPIDIEEMLTGKSLPTYSELAAYLLHTASGISSGQQDLASQNEDGLFYSSDTTDYYLLYENSLDWLRSNDAIFNESHANRICEQNQTSGKRAVVFAAGKYMGQRDLTAKNITFCQLPYEMHRSE